ncbi:uncharacterized protein LOC115708741 [Cannabis sativa]|uniref:uncharacterized protein LOC115708741 n=1 Tax=Cannabis sativa TaxID=3483 RepID=UPI0029CA3D76|nr:uncharacterized protein LOC115708741 [Cannabis sativa]
MATNNNYNSLIGAMDRLWFQQIILVSQPISLPQSTSKSLSPSHHFMSSSLEDEKDHEDLSSDFSHSSNSSNSSESSSESLIPKLPKDDHHDDYEEKLINKKKRPTRSRLVAGSRLMMIRSHSSSPSTKNRKSCPSPIAMVLEKSMSCKSLGELELEELKGFMDLGFIFRKEHVSPRMVNLLPGLQRLEQVYKSKYYRSSHKLERVHANEIEEEQETQQEQEQEQGEEDKERDVIRPYLSEAWLIRKPSSPLLNLRVPRVTAAADMKKHLKFWARTVASEIHQES